MKDWSVLQWILVTSVMDKIIVAQRFITHWCLLISVFVFAFGNFDCAKNRSFAFNCPSDIGQQVETRENILFIMILSLLIMIISPFYYNYIKQHAIKTI